MIIIYSKEDIKALMLKFALLQKGISFVSLKMKKSERDNIDSDIDLIGETCLIDTLRNIEEEYESFDKIEYDHQANNINKMLKKKNSAVKLTIEDIYIALQYINDKSGSVFYHFERTKRFLFKENEKQIYERLIEPYLEIEKFILNTIGVENFYKIHSRGVAKKKAKIIKSNEQIEPILKILSTEIFPVLDKRYEEEFLFYKFITLADIFLLSLIYRMSLFDLFPEEFKRTNKKILDKITKLTSTDVFKKSSLNKYNKHILR